ncbi:putative amidohydrolase [Geomicrobium halophilum]|uniref:Putative amidohydrolase n=1 Tax=Geomicrobium halophilum TaxID=549000 RepID=A0A841PY33_9BACL|nr:carbon-nitrogen family hydrolase [Geomicrobium halophilum]MBB6449162.1 putative amidohydrolase [Geomicrobium halophilum]
MKLAIYQMEVQAGVPDENRKKVQHWLREVAVKHRPDVAVLPEMWTTGYALPDLEEIADDEFGETLTFLKPLAKEYKMDIIAGSIAVKTKGGIVNRALTISKKGELIHTYDKIHLVPMLDEPRYLVGGKEKVTTYDLHGTTMGSLICYDLRFPEISRTLALQGAKVIVVMGEWPAARREQWDALLRARAIENQCFIVAAGAVGGHNGTNYSGHSTVISPWGKIIELADAEKEETLIANIDLTEVNEFRTAVPTFESREPSLY